MWPLYQGWHSFANDDGFPPRFQTRVWMLYMIRMRDSKQDMKRWLYWFNLKKEAALDIWPEGRNDVWAPSNIFRSICQWYASDTVHGNLAWIWLKWDVKGEICKNMKQFTCFNHFVLLMCRWNCNILEMWLSRLLLGVDWSRCKGLTHLSALCLFCSPTVPTVCSTS